MKDFVKTAFVFALTAALDKFLSGHMSVAGVSLADPITLGIAATSISALSLGYGIYSGQQAQKAQARAISSAQDQANQQRADQQAQYADQQKQMAATTASNLAQEQKTKQDTMAAQAQALADEKAAIGTGSQTLSNTLANQNTAAFTKEQPLIEQRLNALGLLSSGALPAQQAKYQADLQSQADAALGNYQVGAQGQLAQNAYASSTDQVAADRANALLNIQNQQQNMAQNFATQGANNQNNTAYQQYINNLQLSQAQSQQQQANAYVGLGGQIGSGVMSYYGNQNNNAALKALQANNQMYGNVSAYGQDNSGLVNSNSWDPRTVSASNSGFYDVRA